MGRRLLGVLAVVTTLALMGACAKSGGGTTTTGTTTGTTTTGTTTTGPTTTSGGTTTGPTTTGSTSAPTTGPTTSGPSIPPVTTLKQGTLTVGSCLDYKPFEFTKNGELTGFDVDIMVEIAKRLGMEAPYVTWVKANFDTIFTALATGQKFDAVAAASTITPEREQIVDFSAPYYNSRQSLTVNKDKTPDVTSTDDLKSGDTVGVQKGTTGKAWAEENLAPNGIQVRTYTNVTDAFTDLEAGRLNGVINDEPSSIAEAQDRPSLEVVQAIDTGEHYGIAINPKNDTLKPAIDAALAALIADGTYKQLFTKYFPTLPLPPEFEPTA